MAIIKKRQTTGGESVSSLMMKIRELETENEKLKSASTGGIVWMNPADILINPELEKEFDINPKVLSNIIKSMEKDGEYNTMYLPLYVDKKYGLFDGHTRRAAAIKAGFKKVPVQYFELGSIPVIREEMGRLQFDRRNATEIERLKYLLKFNLDDLPGEGTKRNRISDLISVSDGTAKKYISLIKSEDKKLLNLVLLGEKTINKAAEFIAEKMKKPNKKKDQGKYISTKPTVIIDPSSEIPTPVNPDIKAAVDYFNSVLQGGPYQIENIESKLLIAIYKHCLEGLKNE